MNIDRGPLTEWAYEVAERIYAKESPSIWQELTPERKERLVADRAISILAACPWQPKWVKVKQFNEWCLMAVIGESLYPMGTATASAWWLFGESEPHSAPSRTAAQRAVEEEVMEGV